ncbi:MAG TPA: fluoride efflux transporter CrcB [Microlunatus sp.]
MSDRHPELPDDPDLPTEPGPEQRALPLHLTPSALGLVAIGGMAGTAARYAVTLVAPARHGWPIGTLAVNLVGAFVLGLLLEALARRGPDQGARRRIRLVAGTGFCGAFTTYSALAVEVDLLLRTAQPATAVAYGLTTVVVGFLACAFGIWIAARGGDGDPVPVTPSEPREAG